MNVFKDYVASRTAATEALRATRPSCEELQRTVGPMMIAKIAKNLDVTKDSPIGTRYGTGPIEVEQRSVIRFADTPVDRDDVQAWANCAGLYTSWYGMTTVEVFPQH